MKLTSNGLIPPELMPAGGVNLVGPFRGDDLCPKYGDETGECIEPDYRNPSQRWPDYVFHTGNSFIIIMKEGETSGHVNAINDDTELQEPIEVFAGDGLIYFETDVLDGTTVVIKAGWHVERGWVTGGAVIAANVLYDNSLAYWVGTNVQTVLDEIGQKAVTLAGVDQVITGRKIFQTDIILSNGKYLQGNDTNGIPRNLAELSINNSANFGVVAYPLYLISSLTPRWYDGIADHWLATHDWVAGNYQPLSAAFSPNTTYNWGAIQNFNAAFTWAGTATGQAIMLAGTGATYDSYGLLSVAAPGSTNAALIGVVANGQFPWALGLDTNIAFVIGQAHPRSGMTPGGWVNKQLTLSTGGILDVSGSYRIAGNNMVQYSGGASYFGVANGPMYLVASSVPAWYDGVNTPSTLATQSWALANVAKYAPAAGGYVTAAGTATRTFGNLTVTSHVANSGVYEIGSSVPAGRSYHIAIATIADGGNVSTISAVPIGTGGAVTVTIRDSANGNVRDRDFNIAIIYTQ